ncbi:MAG TPA: flagellar biosynthesis protein FliQ [Pseudobdellovibrionaceae bacterium]|nr:flagellar biosynthesis protein FliQ [Pseudobdellovibrionaceae bacterium]
MTDELVMRLGQEALKTTAMVSAPLLGSALVIGLIVSIFQAITQINEATLTFVPKMIVIGLVILLAGPWMIEIITVYAQNLFDALPVMVRE